MARATGAMAATSRTAAITTTMAANASGHEGELQIDRVDRARRRRHLEVQAVDAGDRGGAERVADEGAEHAEPERLPQHHRGDLPGAVPMARSVPISRTRSITVITRVFEVASTTSTKTIEPRNQKIPR